MKADELDLLPAEDVRLLDRNRLSDYLLARGWKLKPSPNKGTVDVFERPEDRLAQVRVPASPDLIDYDFVLSRALTLVARWEGRPVGALYADVLYYADDVLEFRERSGDAASGSLSFLRARDLFSGLRRSLLSAAHAVLRPQAHFDRLEMPAAEQFVNRCRFGQTKRGSFVMTVACPLNAVPGRDNLFEPQFTRQVTTHLISAVGLLTQLAEQDDPGPEIPNAAGTPLSANLCEGLLELIPFEEGSRLEISANWGLRRPLEPEDRTPARVILRPEAAPFIESVAYRLRARQGPEPRQYYFGNVDTLAGRPNHDGRREGTVVLRVVDDEGETRRARVELPAGAHDLAVAAYTNNQLVAFRGILRRAGRVSRIDDVEDFRLLPRPEDKPAR